MEDKALFERSIKRIAEDFLRFYGLINRTEVTKKWNPELSVLQNIDTLVNSHDCGLAALAMGIHLYASTSLGKTGYIWVNTNGAHWYLCYWDGRIKNDEVVWDTAAAFGKFLTNEHEMRGFSIAEKIKCQEFEQAIADILNNDVFGQTILFQWLYLSFPNVGIEVSGNTRLDLIRLLRKLLEEPTLFVDDSKFPPDDNLECIYSSSYQANLNKV